jgi:antitoxin (DNA-binding transcriptional repressor) of toxin-antitoxin stability system
MKTITITEAKRSLGQYLKQAAAGEEIGIVSGADIISLRKVEVVPADRVTVVRVMESEADDWPVFEAADGGPADGALNHDKYVYDNPHGVRKARKR